MNKNHKDNNNHKRAQTISRPRMGRGGGGRNLGAVEKAKDFKGTMKKLLIYIKPYYKQITFSAIFSILGALLSITGPLLLGKMTTAIYNAYDLKTEIGLIKLFGLSFNLTQIIILTALVELTAAIFNYTQSYLLVHMTQNLTFELRGELAHKINKLPLNYFDKMPFGDTLSRMTNDLDTINQTLMQSLSEIFRGITLVIGILVIMFVLSWILALTVLITTILSMIVARKFIKISQKYFRRQARELGDLNGHIEEMYSGHSIIKAFGQQKSKLAEFNIVNNKLTESATIAQFISGIMMPVQFFFSNLSYILIVVIGALLVGSNNVLIAIEFGVILTFIQYGRRINQPIRSITNIANVLQQTAASSERVFELLGAEEEKDESDKLSTFDNLLGNVTFKDVYFSYDKEVEVIKGFSSKVKEGQTIAIVGPTGAGKTTIVNLLMRFYEIDDGQILIDNNDIYNYQKKAIRNTFGMVLQDTWLFEGTILDNIKYGSSDKSFEEVKKAAKLSQIDHFIESLPNGYDFMLTEGGTNISQGQRQLVTICRAMLSNRPMLILDEATSNVDTRTEVLIQKAMDELMKNRTSFVIAHRLSTIRDADLILAIRDGNIVEKGNHEELLKLNGFYANLYNSQFEN